MTLSIVFCALLLVIIPQSAKSHCCSGVEGRTGCEGKYCADCKVKGNFNCCDKKGTCNIFCCDCDHECREPPEGKETHCTQEKIALVYTQFHCGFVDKRSKRARGKDQVPKDDDPSLATEKFKKVDHNKDKKISKNEMKAFFGKHMKAGDLNKEFSKLDKNKSGFIEAPEFDSGIQEDEL